MDIIALQGALRPLDTRPRPGPEDRLAAVLLGVSRWWSGQGQLLAIRRAKSLRDHSGQVGFPGGKVEAQDASLAQTALRESFEEIGLEPERVQLMGQLGPVPTPTRFWVVPFVGLLDLEGWSPRIDEGEVDELLWISRGALEDPQNYEAPGYFQRGGHRVPRHTYHVCEPSLWGASALMVHDLLRRWADVAVDLSSTG